MLFIFVREGEKLLVNFICIQNLVRVFGLFSHLADREIVRLEMVVLHVSRYFDGELIHRLVGPLVNFELLLHRGVIVLVEVHRLAHVKVRLSKVCGVDELTDQNSHLVTGLGGQDHISLLDDSVFEARSHSRGLSLGKS